MRYAEETFSSPSRATFFFKSKSKVTIIIDKLAVYYVPCKREEGREVVCCNFELATSGHDMWRCRKFWLVDISEKILYWWLIRVTLVVTFGFFPPKFWEVVGSYESSSCLKMNAAWVVWTIIGGGNTQILLAQKQNWTLCTLRQWGCKNFVIFPSSLALVRHLVKLSVSNIC